MWTLDELVDRVRAALAAQYPGAPNGRVRDVPDKRAVRWYTTIGLVDRPAAMRGRTALYGERHLLQLVAVKRLQAGGNTLAEIQARLAGATDRALAEVARVPARLLGPPGAAEPGAPTRARFWAAPPPDINRGAAAALIGVALDTGRDHPRPAGPPTTDTGPAAPLGAVDLGRGVILVVPGRPGPDDHVALAAAARPLLDLLAARGLLTGPRPDDQTDVSLADRSDRSPA
jgi:hypothetical protein